MVSDKKKYRADLSKAYHNYEPALWSTGGSGTVCEMWQVIRYKTEIRIEDLEKYYSSRFN